MNGKRLTAYLFVILLSVAATGSAGGRQLTFFTIEVPGAVSTSASGINAAGDIVGSYFDGTRTRGFLLGNGIFTPIEVPGSAFSDARGIGPSGEIVGTYRLPGEPALNFHGYLLTQAGAFLPLDVPGHTSTIPQRILPDGTVLGCRHDWDFMETMRGVVIGPHGFDEIDTFASMHNGATPDRRLIAGLYTDMETGRGRGYVIADGTFLPFDVPGSTFTAAWDMNPAGAIVGTFNLPGGIVRGFLRQDDQFTTLHVPGSTVTRAFGINARGDIVGNYLQGGVTRGYIATTTPAREPR